MSKPLNLRKKKLEKYFGILNEKEAQELWKEIKERRKNYEKKKMLGAIKRLGELLEKIGANSEENIKIIREIRGK